MKNNWLRKIMMISAMATFGLLAGCNSDDVTYDKAEITATPSTVEIASGSANPVTEPAAVTFEINATRPWKMSPNTDEWLVITSADGKPESGDAGKKVMTATATINSTGATRTATVIFAIDYRTSTMVTFTQKGENEVPVGELIYNETVGTQAVSGTAPSTWPFVGDYTGWAKTGKGATNVTYSGTSASIRTSSPSSGYEGASGPNIVFFGGTSNNLTINKIDVTGETNLVFKFGVSDNSGTASPYTVPVTAATIKLSASINGTDWTPLTFTNANTAAWVLATASFSVPSGTTELYIKLADAIGADGTGSKIRIDDFSLYSGGSGGPIIGVPAPTVTASAATAVGETAATIGGTFTAPTGVTVTEAGVEWKKTADATFTKVPVAGAATGVAFTHNLTGLVKATPYTYRAYATTADGTTYSGEMIFNTTDPGRVYKTIAEVRAYGVGGTIPENVYVKGIVIGQGNSTSKKNIVIQDDAAGITIRSEADYVGADGDEIEVVLNGLSLAEYQGLLQLANVPATSIAKIGIKAVVIKDITAAQLITGAFESMYVSVAGVQVVGEDLTKTMGGTAHTSIKVETLTESFVMFTSSYAAFKGDNVPQGSGELKGVASINKPEGGVATYQILPTAATDYAAMKGTRFGGISFGAVTFEGVLKATEAVPAGTKIKIPYFTAAGTESFNVTGTSTDGGITIDPIAITPAAGNGFIEIPVTGTPTAAGEVTFTISGLTALTANTVKATILEAGAGNPFEAYWNMQGIPVWGESPMAATDNNNAAVTVGGLTKNGFTNPAAGTPGANSWAISDCKLNIDKTAPDRFASFTVNSTGILSLESLGIICKMTKTGPYEVSVQYSVAGGAYVEAKQLDYVATGSTVTFPMETVDLTGQAALQNLVAGTEVTFRIVPMKTADTTTGNWSITNVVGGQGLTIKGSTK